MTDTGDLANRGRREARERAVELAYEADRRQITTDELIEALPIAPAPFTIELLRAGEKHRIEAERLIGAKARGWSVERMPVMDRLIMVLAVAELLSFATPPGVILAEAVDLASRYSTEESARFVNGVLAAVVADQQSS